MRALARLGAALALAGCAAEGERDVAGPAARGPDLALPGEDHLENVRQLTFGGQNAEAYFAFDDSALIFQSTRGDLECDQIFVLDLETGEQRRLTSEGRQTCGYFLPGNERVLFASTRSAGPGCPPEPDRSMGYVWPLYESYEIYVADADGSDPVNVTNSPGYDAEATVSRDGRVVFTSIRSGDLELWTMDADGSELRQLTDEAGYDGGAFFSRDGRRIVWRASRFEDDEERTAYFDLLDRGLVQPSRLDVYVMDADGGNVRRLTDNGKANFAPFFTPDGDAVLFASNMADPKGRIFDIWRIGVDGTGLERITHNPSFDGFPMFSWDGRRLVFASNRNNTEPYETNVFIADWVD